MKLFIVGSTFLFSLQVLGQNSTFYKTIGKKNLHYLEFSNDNLKVYKMGTYYDKAGSGSAIRFTDTLFSIKENEFKGRQYTLVKNENHYILFKSNETKYEIELVNDNKKVLAELNNAYCLKRYFDLSDKLNKEFPLYNYSFRNGYYAWEKQSNKTNNHNKFIEQIDKEIAMIYDSVHRIQKSYTLTSNFIIANVKQAKYSILKDSINKLPIDYRPQSGYFDKSVYEMAKANPEYFYKLLLDFPASKQFIYFAVEQDKELVIQLKKVQGYEGLKKDFLKYRKQEKSFAIWGITFYTVSNIALLGGIMYLIFK